MKHFLRGRFLHFRDTTQAPFCEPEYFDDGVLVVDGARITALLPAAEAFAQGVRVEQCRVLGNKLVVPGFIDTHVHAYQLDMIASYGEQLLTWLERYTFPAELRMADAAKADDVAEAFLQQLLMNGTTSALVFSTSHQRATDILFTRAAQREMCLITGKTLMDRNAPTPLLDDPERGFDESLALIEKWHKFQRLFYAVTPRFAITSTPGQLKAAARLLQRTPDLYLQTHLAENTAEVAMVKQLYPNARHYLDVYDSMGLCTDRSVFAHGVHLSDAEVERLRKAGATVACCPTSNLFLGSGLFPWRRMREAKLKLSVATDVGGGTSLSMLETLRDLYKVSQLTGGALSPLEGFHAITLGNAKALGLQHRIGTLEAGTDADFVILDPDADPLLARRVGSVETIADEWFLYMTLGSARIVSETWVAGRQCHGQLPRKKQEAA